MYSEGAQQVKTRPNIVMSLTIHKKAYLAESVHRVTQKRIRLRLAYNNRLVLPAIVFIV